MKFVEMDPNGVWARSPRWAKVGIAVVVAAIVGLYAVLAAGLATV
jgi:hypothetical protein